MKSGSRFLVLSLCAVLWIHVSACGSYEDGDELLEIPPAANNGGVSVAIDWPDGSSPRLGELLKAVRPLQLVADRQLSSSAPITIPASVPSNVYLAIDLPTSMRSADVAFTRSCILIQDQCAGLVSEPVMVPPSANAPNRVAVVVSGLNAVMSSIESIAGELEIQLFGSSARTATVRLILRTPPRQLRPSMVPLRDWKSQADSLRSAAIKLVVSGKRLNLFRVLRLQNEETAPIEVHFPRRPSATFTQWVNSLTHRDTGCGFAVDESPRWEPIADEVIALPIGPSIITDAATTIAKPTLRDRMGLSLAPGEMRFVGLYAIGARADEWLDGGAVGPELRQIGVPSSCYEVCVERECECVRCGLKHQSDPIGWLLRSPGAEQRKGCFCIRKAIRRNSATVTVGVNRGTPRLSVADSDTSWPTRFSDLDFSQDSQSRAIPAIPSASDVAWF